MRSTSNWMQTGASTAVQRREAWMCALHDSQYLVTPKARKRSLAVLDGVEDRVSAAAQWILLDGGAQQGLNAAPWAGRNKLATERWKECVDRLKAALTEVSA